MKNVVNPIKVKKTCGIFYKMLSTAQMDRFLKNGLWEDGGFGWGRAKRLEGGVLQVFL
jgi:hypothetical protein